MGELLPANLLATIPPLYSVENDADPVAVVKLFTPDGGWTWWVLEAGCVDVEGIVTTDDESDVLMFCLVQGHDTELGYVSLNEILSYRSRLGLAIERDIHFRPTKLSEIRASID